MTFPKGHFKKSIWRIKMIIGIENLKEKQKEKEESE